VDYRSSLHDVTVPVLYLQGQAGRLVPRWALRAIARIRPGVQVAEFDAPHFLLQIRAIEAARRVQAFMERL
jgi:pimeloyl-[acyl-carrier protein] methyl ester esterase